MRSGFDTRTNYPELTGLERGKVLIPTYDWKAYLGPFFKHTSNVSKKHHFRMLTSEPGVLYSRVNLNTEEVKDVVEESTEEQQLDDDLLLDDFMVEYEDEDFDIDDVDGLTSLEQDYDEEEIQTEEMEELENLRRRIAELEGNLSVSSL